MALQTAYADWRKLYRAECIRKGYILPDRNAKPDPGELDVPADPELG